MVSLSWSHGSSQNKGEKGVRIVQQDINLLFAVRAVPTVYAQSTVSVYGVVDTGFGVMKGKGQQTSVQAVSGGNAASRWGLTGKRRTREWELR